MLLGLSFGSVSSRRPPFAQSSGLVPGMASWFDAGQGITQSSGKVSAWASRVGSDVVTQATAANQPTYSANINGFPAITTDGSTQCLFGSGAAAALSAAAAMGPFTLFSVVRPSQVSAMSAGYDWAGFSHSAGSAGGKPAVYYIGHQNTHMLIWKLRDANDGVKFYGGQGGGVAVGKSMVCCTKYTGSVYTHFMDGALKYTSGSDALPVTFDTLSVGALYTAASGLLSMFKGDIAEIVLYPSFLSTSDQQANEAYFRTKYGTA